MTRWFFRCFKAMPKRRWSRDIASIREMRRRLDAGSAVGGIFPEGQRNWDGGGPWIVGDEVVQALAAHGCPGPLRDSCRGGHEAWPRWSKLPGGICDMTVRFFEPIDPGDYRDVADFRHAVEARISISRRSRLFPGERWRCIRELPLSYGGDALSAAAR